ncbi:MAG: T9SS type A sorting domain-containing protein [Crocinitomicaceae bacterium]|nr:T9SS type A sorting domain-containing protein [Crocinitomicaceae bacterium]
MLKKFIFAVVLMVLCGKSVFCQNDSTEWIPPTKPIKSNRLKAAPVNDDCSSATTLIIDAGLDLTGTTFDATLQGGECYTNYGGGASEHTVWYRFNANNDSLVFAFNKTNYTNCVSPHARIYGPVAVAGGCLPACGTEIYSVLHNGDPGTHTLLTSLNVGMDYLVQVQDLDCGGPNDGHVEFAIGIFSPPKNNIASGADGIDQCGVVYNGTNTGYSQEDLIPGEDNLDNNASTTCPSCVTAGDDVPYVVNNSSWFTFCATDAGTWNVDFADIANCVNPSTSDGLQMTIFRGTASNLTLIEHAPSPSEPGTSWTSADFSVSAGECIFMVVDGFAGDQCDYSYTLNNVTGGCNLVSLPINLLEYKAEITEQNSVRLLWSTLTEENNSHFTIEKSIDGERFNFLTKVNGAGNSNELNQYNTKDNNPYEGTSYYRLSQTDFNGKSMSHGIVAINNNQTISNLIVVPNPTVGNANILYQSGNSGLYNVSIYDLAGRKLSSKFVNVQKGSNQTPIDTFHLPSGMYFTVISNEGAQQNARFVKE